MRNANQVVDAGKSNSRLHCVQRILRATLAFLWLSLLGGFAFAQTATTTALTLSSSTIYEGQSSTLTATVTGSNPTGNVTFRDGATTLSTVTVNAAGVASTTRTFTVTGAHNLTATYNGNTANAPSTSAEVVLNVAPKLETTTTLTVTPSALYQGQSATVNVSVTGSTPTGTVTIREGTTSRVSLTLSAAGTASTSITFNTLGERSLTAVYSGNSTNATSTSSPTVLTVNPKQNSSVTLTANPSPSMAGQAIALTATVTGNNPTGTVYFYNGTTHTHTWQLDASGATSVQPTYTTPGTVNLTARYLGDATHSASESAVLAHTVTTTPTTTQLTCPASTPLATAISCTVTVVAPVTVSALSGATVTIVENGSTVASGPLTYVVSPGTYRSTISLPGNVVPISTAGQHTLVARAPTTAMSSTSDSSPVTVTVQQRATTTTLAASPSTAGATQIVTLTANVASGLNATGTVTFRDGSTPIATVPLSGTEAAIATSFTTPGSHALSAVYNGDNNNAGSTSATVNETVTATSPTTTSLTVTPASIQAGDAATLTASIAGSSASGTVVFRQGDTVLGQSSASGGQASLSSTFSIVGTHNLTADYWGDTANGASTSAPAALTVTLETTSTALTSPLNRANQNQPVPLTASVAGANPGGTVTFREGSTTLGTAPVVNGSATLSPSFPDIRSYVLNATYGGDANNSPSTSDFFTVQIEPGPAPASSTAPVHRYEYDAQGNPTKAIVAPGVSGFNLTTLATYDSLSRVKDTTDPKLGRTQFQYTGRDELTQVTDPRNLVTQYPRNGLGDATSLVSPDTGSASHTYDEAGNLKTRSDSRGVLGTYTYDALNRLTQTAYTHASLPSQTYGWAYDETGAGFSHGVGRLTSTSHPSGSTQYSYDALGRLVSDVQRVNQVAGGNGTQFSASVGYGYDTAGNLTHITYPSGRQVQIAYANGQPTALSLAPDAASTSMPLISALQFEPFGGVKSWRWQLNGGATQLNEKVYDTSGRIVRYRLGNSLRDLTYDAGDRITSYTHYDATTGEPQSNLDQGFGYDENGRLTSITTATASWTLNYDANGNRTSVTLNGTPSTYTTETTSNRLSAITNPARSFGYDSAGNTTSDSTNYSSTYDAAGRLATLTKAGVTTTYSYNGLGQRVRKFSSTGSSSTVLFVYDQSGQLLGEYNNAGQAIREYVWLGSTPVAMFTPNGAGNPPSVYHLHTDHLDTPRVVTGTSGSLRWRWLAEPFGTTVPENNPAGLGVVTMNLRFPGQFADSESGLYYNYFRSYDSSTGRYTTSDPIGLAGGINTYAYVYGNPLRYTDPQGLFVPLVIAGVCAAGGCEAAGAVLAAGAIWWATQHPVVMPVAVPEPMYAKPPRVNDPQAQAEHDEYKDNYRRPSPPSPDPCDDLRGKLEREKELLRARTAWDAKWLPGRHAGMNGEIQSQNAIRKLEEKMKNQGCCP